MKRLAFFSAVLVSMFFCVQSFGAERIKFGTFPIPLMVVDEQNGVFIELTKTIAQGSNLDIEFIIAPPKRTISDFLENKIEVLFPALDVSFPVGIKPIKSKELIYIKEDFVFTKKGNPMLKSLKDLKGKKIGITRGYPYARELTDNDQITVDVANSDELNVRKLMKGRIDAFVVEEKSGLKSFENEGINDFQYDPDVPVSKQDVYYAFQNNENGKDLANILSKVLGLLKQDGTFNNIMKTAEQQK